jgi:hypothetical protein
MVKKGVNTFCVTVTVVAICLVQNELIQIVIGRTQLDVGFRDGGKRSIGHDLSVTAACRHVGASKMFHYSHQTVDRC